MRQKVASIRSAYAQPAPDRFFVEYNEPNARAEVVRIAEEMGSRFDALLGAV